MFEVLRSLILSIRWQDLADIAIVSMVIYQIIVLIRGTRAVQMLLGLLFILVLYVVASYAQLQTTKWMMDRFLSDIFLIIIILFQNDIRRGLARIGMTTLFARISKVEESQLIGELTRAAVNLSSKKIGALVVLEREMGLNDFIEIGIKLDSSVTKEILYSIFLPYSPIHDGAVMIQNGRITAAKCVLPLSMDPEVSKAFGTRHRAALGLASETDAVVVVVSEETGSIGLAVGGRIIRNLDGQGLRGQLEALMSGSNW